MSSHSSECPMHESSMWTQDKVANVSLYLWRFVRKLQAGNKRGRAADAQNLSVEQEVQNHRSLQLPSWIVALAYCPERQFFGAYWF